MAILQGSEQWKEARQSKIGGSEIFSLVHYYCAEELRSMGFDLTKERPFRTIQEMFLKVKFGAELSSIDPVHSQFGNGLEPYVAYRLSLELPQLKIERTKEFIAESSLHNLASCSPDGYLELPEFPEVGQDESFFLPDFDKTCKIDSSWSRGMLELKTANYFSSFDESGSKLAYIFQLCYNCMVAGCNWGVLAILTPKQKEFDEPFFKGQAFRMAVENEFEEMDQYYDLTQYTYAQLHGYRAMILKALCAFQADLDNPDAYPRNTEDKAGIEREKKMLGQIDPEKYGTLNVEAESELDDLLNQRMIAQGAMLDAEKEMRNCECEIIAQTRRYCEVIGTKHKLKWTSHGQTRFTKINNKTKE